MANELNDLGIYSPLIAHALEDGVFCSAWFSGGLVWYEVIKYVI